jgi:phosphatidylglycerol:prolipoprotein diacylglycerol transferase
VQFPVYFHVFGVAVHPHPVMEGIAYLTAGGMQIFIRRRVRAAGASGTGVENVSGGMGGARQREEALVRGLWVIVGAVTGALVGGKVLAWLESFGAVMEQVNRVGLIGLVEGKTIVGALVGAWIGVEIAKKLVGEKARTGDFWVYPLCVSIAIGRVGCFLTGLSDQTHGVATGLPWGVDFGDGVLRHPTQLYEIGVVILLGVVLGIYQRASGIGWETGRVFRLFMLGYCGWRFGVEFIKPSAKVVGGMSVIQVVCLGVCGFCVWELWGRRGLRASRTTT